MSDITSISMKLGEIIKWRGPLEQMFEEMQKQRGEINDIKKAAAGGGSVPQATATQGPTRTQGTPQGTKNIDINLQGIERYEMFGGVAANTSSGQTGCRNMRALGTQKSRSS